ncbi:MAG: DUF5011 domain-containing protein [Candidatus Izemoplasmatales bacterium]|nr:DUF5011 domain-containing protein [Candidatus Izemoplasmatales bacterium]
MKRKRGWWAIGLGVGLIVLSGCMGWFDSTTTTTNVPISTTQPTTNAPTTATQGELNIWLNPGVDTVEINSVFVDSGADATFNSIPVAAVKIESTLDMTKTGIYQIVYRAEVYGQKCDIVRYVTVIDETPPLASLNPGIDTIVEGSVWVDTGIHVLDNSLGDVIVTTEGYVSCAVPGEYMIKYLSSDESGNVTETYRYITVLPVE